MSNIHNILPKNVNQWLDSGEAILIDVREIEEYNVEFINRAKNIPLSTLVLDDAHKGKRVVIHCKSGKRSMLACEKLISLGAEFDVWNMEGGINAWKDSGLAVNEKAK